MSKKMVVDWSGVTPGQLQDLLRQFGDGSLTSGQLQAFLEHRNPFERTDVDKVLSFACEEVYSDFGYPKEYYVRMLEEQLQVWKKYFPELKSDHVSELASGGIDFSMDTEGWGVIPKIFMVGGSYYEALEKMLKILNKEREFKNNRGEELGPNNLRLARQTDKALRKLEQDTPGDFLVIPFQFGMRHQGRSVRRARVCFAKNEFGFGPYEVAALLITHPDRITGLDQLYIDCGGCEYAFSNTDDRFDFCLNFKGNSDHDCLSLQCDWHGRVASNRGLVSGFFVSQ